jgi:hypothetical protein
MTITSPPFWNLRNYSKLENSIDVGIEESPEEYITQLKEIFMQVFTSTKQDGILWLNLGDSYASGQMNGVSGPNSNIKGYQKRYGELPRRKIPKNMKKKDLVGIPWWCATELRNNGWYLRSPVVLKKKFFQPEPQQKDRPVKSYEMLFLLSKSYKYLYNQLLNENGAPLRDVWDILPVHSPQGHPASFSLDLVQKCIQSGSNEGDIVFDPFGGINTVGKIAKHMNRKSIVIELNPEFCKIGDIENNCELLTDKTYYKQEELF